MTIEHDARDTNTGTVPAYVAKSNLNSCIVISSPYAQAQHPVYYSIERYHKQCSLFLSLFMYG